MYVRGQDGEWYVVAMNVNRVYPSTLVCGSSIIGDYCTIRALVTDVDYEHGAKIEIPAARCVFLS